MLSVVPKAAKVVIGDSRSSKHLSHMIILEHILSDLGLHLTPPIVHDFETLIY